MSGPDVLQLLTCVVCLAAFVSAIIGAYYDDQSRKR